ncbi:protein LST8 homolog [Toxorhynchites rutilus septentrionalis]|uniref:protein LST8 homolog n=1 Tax=Toxorhynchites rutilus septentrionalis TaxID=329112 RepID=UPI002478E478|nr:protein LST8 homolog [Toxorhynchites rutilus septentrionalis]
MSFDLFSEPILATGGYDHAIKLWQPYSGFCYRTLQHNESQVNALDIIPNGTLLAAGGYQHIRLYDINVCHPIVDYDCVLKNVTRVGFQEDGKWMFTGGEDCRVRIWDINSRIPLCQRIFDSLTPVNAVCLHPNQVELAIGTQGGSVYLWDVKSDVHDQLVPEVEASIQDIAISPNGAFMAAINNKGNCYIWSLSNSTNSEMQLTKTDPKLRVEAHKKYGLRCRFSPDSSMLVTCSGDGTAKIFRTESFQLHVELKIDKYWMWDAVFSNDSKYLFTASSDGKARLWKIETKSIEREYHAHMKAITALAFRDGIAKS